MDNIAIIIPARYNSSRLNNKLLIKFNNKPVILHTYEKVMQSQYVKKGINTINNYNYFGFTGIYIIDLY